MSVAEGRTSLNTILLQSCNDITPDPMDYDEEDSKDEGTNKDNDKHKDKDKNTQYPPPILSFPLYILFWPRLTRLMSKDPLVSVVISSMSNGSNIRLSLVQVMNWKGGWDSM